MACRAVDRTAIIYLAGVGVHVHVYVYVRILCVFVYIGDRQGAEERELIL